MAGYRQIHTQIWKDDWVIELDPIEKLFFIYLFSNDLASISGLYKIPIKAMVNETGISKGKIESMLAKFQAAGKVFYGDNTLFIKNMMRYHQNASPKTKEKIRKDIASVPDCEIKSIAIQYLYGIDTVSILGSESRSISVIENLNESVSNCSDSDFQEFMDAFCDESKLVPGNGINWVDPIFSMLKAGYHGKDARRAVIWNRDNGYPVTSPKSIQTTIAGKVEPKKKTKRQMNEDTGEYEDVAQ